MKLTRSEMKDHLAYCYDSEEMDEDTRAAILDQYEDEAHDRDFADCDDDDLDEDDLPGETGSVRDMIAFCQSAYPAVRRPDRFYTDAYDVEFFWDAPDTAVSFCLKSAAGWSTIDGFMTDAEDCGWSIAKSDKAALGRKLRSPGYRKYLIAGAA